VTHGFLVTLKFLTTHCTLTSENFMHESSARAWWKWLNNRDKYSAPFTSAHREGFQDFSRGFVGFRRSQFLYFFQALLSNFQEVWAKTHVHAEAKSSKRADSPLIFGYQQCFGYKLYVLVYFGFLEPRKRVSHRCTELTCPGGDENVVGMPRNCVVIVECSCVLSTGVNVQCDSHLGIAFTGFPTPFSRYTCALLRWINLPRLLRYTTRAYFPSDQVF
jgi:hypothetical protein